MVRVYLLAVDGLRRRMEETAAQSLPGWDRLASWQQEKVSRCAQTGARARCMGGQLLLQYGAHRRGTDGETLWQELSYPALLEGIPAPLPLPEATGPWGKPWLPGLSWHYNLSHSGDYAALAVNDAPVGVDIQQMRPCREPLAGRFFSAEEAAAQERLPAGERQELFYTLWCRKEAYGKLLGTGLTEEVLKRNMLEGVGVPLYEYEKLPGYRICVCGGEG